MHAKVELKEKAIKLRLEGFSYNEILRQVPVAKSTLSLWLQSVFLAEPQAQRLTEKKIAAQKRGAQARKIQRIEKQNTIYAQSALDIGTLTKREMWLVGSVLYWGEGSKEKEHNPGKSVQFINSDLSMVAFFLNWLIYICGVDRSRFRFNIHIHENCIGRIETVKKYWSDGTGFPITEFDNVYYKRHKPSSKRRNKGDLYYGCLKVKVNGSSELLRKITGWNRAISNSFQSILTN